MPGKPLIAPKHRRQLPGHAPGEVRIIGGRLKRSKLVVTKHPGLRPTPDRVRETLFNWLGQDLTGQRCLDMFAGSGALGLEAASRGAAWVDLVERDARLAKTLTDACTRLGVTEAHVHTQEALQFARRCSPESYALVFIDPPFDQADAGLHAAALAAAALLLPAGGMAYIEAPDARQLTDWAAGSDWAVYRQGRAGNVHYALLQRQPRTSVAA
jgi:16S rRNA (guanine(966)-N(2))-methyltransferase RsmD